MAVKNRNFDLPKQMDHADCRPTPTSINMIVTLSSLNSIPVVVGVVAGRTCGVHCIHGKRRELSSHKEKKADNQRGFCFPFPYFSRRTLNSEIAFEEEPDRKRDHFKDGEVYTSLVLST